MRRALVALAAGVLLASTACSLGPKEDWAEAIRDANDRSRAAGTARVRMATEVSVIETVIRQEPAPLVARMEGVADLRAGRARLQGSAPPKPVVVFDDLTVYLPRSAVSIGTGTRRWARFDFTREPDEDLDDTDRLRTVGAGVISPLVALEALEGVLTGSLERGERRDVAGTSTTHYRGRVSQDSLIREIDEDDRKEGMQRLFESLGAGEDLFDVEVWLDDEGLARRVAFHLRQQKDRVNAFRLVLTWEFFDYGARIGRVSVPPRAQTVSPARVREFIEEFIRAAA